MKRTVNFRFSGETLSLLKDLAEKASLSRTWVLESLVYRAATGKEYPRPLVAMPRNPDPGFAEFAKTAPKLDEKSATGGVKRVQEIPVPDWVRKDIQESIPPGTPKPLTREEREAKIAEAQKWLRK